MTLSDSDEDIIAEKAEEAKAARKKPWKIHRPRGNMHDANIYRYYRPDFRELARTYPGVETPTNVQQSNAAQFHESTHRKEPVHASG